MPEITGQHYVDENYKEFYDHVSRNQDLGKRLASFENYRSYHYKDQHYVKSYIQSHDVRNVLDIGCCGSPYPRLFDLDKVDYVGIDISEISLKRTSELYKDDRITWLVDDACSLSRVADNSFDLIIATQVLEHLPNPGVAYDKMIRKLRKGGSLLIGTESALFVNPECTRKYLGTISEISMLLGSVYLVYGQEPLFYLHTLRETFQNKENRTIEIEVPHGHFHPDYFDYRIKMKKYPVKVVQKRVTGGILIDTFFALLGKRVLFGWYDLKSLIPVIKHFGNQIFVILRKDPF